MTDDTLLPFALPSVQRKKLTAAFDGGRISSDGGLMLLGTAERRIGVAEKLAAEIADPRDRHVSCIRLPTSCAPASSPSRAATRMPTTSTICRSDPGLKLAFGHLPDSGRDLCSQPAMSRWENAPTLREVIRLLRVMVALYCGNYDRTGACRPRTATRIFTMTDLSRLCPSVSREMIRKILNDERTAGAGSSRRGRAGALNGKRGDKARIVVINSIMTSLSAL